MPDVKPSAFTQAALASLTTDSIPYTKDQTTTPLDRRATLQQFWDAINLLTAETAPALADKIPIYDADGAQADSITPDNLFKAVNLFTELADPDVGDFFPVYDASASAIRKIDYDNLVKESFIVACSDLTTAITTGTNKGYFRVPYAFTITEVRASVLTAGTTSVITIDINESGTTILSTKLSIDASEKTSETAATPAVISDTALADDAEITIDFDAVDSGGTGAGVLIEIIGHRT